MTLFGKPAEKLVNSCHKEPPCPGLDASFFHRAKWGGREEKIKKKINSPKLLQLLPPSSQTPISSFLQPFTGGPGQGVSCELTKKGISV